MAFPRLEVQQIYDTLRAGGNPPFGTKEELITDAQDLLTAVSALQKTDAALSEGKYVSTNAIDEHDHFRRAAGGDLDGIGQLEATQDAFKLLEHVSKYVLGQPDVKKPSKKELNRLNRLRGGIMLMYSKPLGCTGYDE